MRDPFKRWGIWRCWRRDGQPVDMPIHMYTWTHRSAQRIATRLTRNTGLKNVWWEVRPMYGEHSEIYRWPKHDR